MIYKNSTHPKLNQLKSNCKNKPKHLNQLEQGYFLEEIEESKEFPRHFVVRYGNEIIHEFCDDITIDTFFYGGTTELIKLKLKEIIKIHKRDYKLSQILG